MIFNKNKLVYMLASLSLNCCDKKTMGGQITFTLRGLPEQAASDFNADLSRFHAKFMDLPEDILSLELHLTNEDGLFAQDTEGKDINFSFSREEPYLYVSGIEPADNLTLTVNGLSDGGLIYYQGSISGVNIKEGETTALGTLELQALKEPKSSTQPASSTSGQTSQGNVILAGAGTNASPYLIDSAEKLKSVHNGICGLATSGCSAVLQLTQDIDMEFQSFTPLASSTQAFEGTFDGKGFKIKNLAHTKTTLDAVGLVSMLGPNGKILNLIIEDAVVAGKNNVGIIVGVSSGTIDNVRVTGSVSGSENVGGIVGLLSEGGMILNSQSQAVTTATGDNAGGLAGKVDTGIISKSNASGKVTSAAGKAGGAIGYLQATKPTILNFISASGDVSGVTQVGGLVGEVSGSISLVVCSAQGRVDAAKTSGSMTGGGLIGIFGGTLLEKCSARGAVQATGVFLTTNESGFGGLIGRLDSGQVLDSYAWGSVSGVTNGGPAGALVGQQHGGEIRRTLSTGKITTSSHKGGVIGRYVSGIFSDIYWDTESTGMSHTYQDSSGQAAGSFNKSTAECRSASTFANWNFVSTWSISEGVSYPVLRETP